MSKWNVRLNKSGEMWFRFFVHAKSAARKGMKMPIKKKHVHIRIIWVSGILRSLRECIRHSISRSNLEWARDLEEKSWRRIWNPFAPELTWDTLKLSSVHIYEKFLCFEKSYRPTSRALSKTSFRNGSGIR